ncbi:hypothetical protein ACS0TY_026425 [Phlomoides rotata]
MAPPIRPAANFAQSHGGSGDGMRLNPPSHNLWIGNVSPEVSEAELKSLFEKFGQIDGVTTYSSRNYAFVQFKEVEDARSAKQGLQGLILRGNSLKIEFAKPAKPCKSLWVAGINQSVSKEELENEFLKFGAIQEFKFIRDKNTAYVDYVALEDATQALKGLNGKRIGGVQIRVDYLRSQSSKREHGEGHFPGRNFGSSDFHWMGHDSSGNYPEPNLSGSKRNPQFPTVGPQYGDATFSKVLWIRYPTSVIIEEDMLHNALILFGEIERIKTFSEKSYAFVEFRSVEEARRAKEGLQGKLFNDPRILIEYFNSEFPGGRGQTSEYSLHPVQMDILGLNRPGLLGNNSGHPSSLVNRGPDLYLRPPYGPHNTFEAAGHGQELVDLAAVHPSPNTLMGGPSWKRASPTPGIVSSPSAGFNVPNRSASGPWDVFDTNQLQRESKRLRFEAALPSERTELDDQYGPHIVRSGETSGSLARGINGGLGQRHAESDCIWRGLIAKGGTPVCRARCVPVGEGLAADIPDVVNCSARTGLDLLTKHYEDATGFDIVFFVPDSEEDFASYTEFLRYLGSKDRAGVAKFDDGTTLFLVPPSDFLTKVLKVSGPERLYGVVLKFPLLAPSSTAEDPRSIHLQHVDPHKLAAFPTGYGSMQQEERILPLDSYRLLPEDPKMPPKAHVPMTSSFPAQSVAAPTTVASQAGLSLTPELIATLTSLLPSNNGSGLQTASLLQSSSAMAATSHVASGPDNMAYWKHEHQTLDQNAQLAPQFGRQMNPHLQHPQAAQAAPLVSSTTGHFHQIFNSNSQVHEYTMNSGTQGATSSKMTPVPLQSGQFSVAPDVSQHYQQGSSQDVFWGQGIENGPDSRLYNPSVIQQSAYSMPSSNQLHFNGVPQPQPYMPVHSDVEIASQSQPPQTAAPFGVIQEGAETEADKNERYKSTLLFAANLLSQIHQPSGNQPGQGDGNQ